MHRLTVLLAAAAAVSGLGSTALAQEPSRPTLTVARFEGTLKSSQAGDAGADLADAIATRVEESGCCRVMLRAFLSPAAPGTSPSLEAGRQAAIAARVQYVIAGRASTSRAIPRPSVPSIATVLGQMRPGPSVRGPMAPRIPYPIPALPRPVTVVTLEMRIIDAASGQVLRTLNVSRPPGTNVVGLVTDSPDVSDSLIGAISNLGRVSRN